MPWRNKQLEWDEFYLPRPLAVESILSILTQTATLDRYSQIVFEARARDGRIHYLLGVEPSLMKRIKQMMHGELAGLRFNSKVERRDVISARSVKLSHPQLALNTSNQTATIRAVLAALVGAGRSGDEAVLQIILGQSLTPSLLPSKLNDPSASWLDLLRGSVASASSESRALMKEKLSSHGFMATIRIGAVAMSGEGNVSLPKTANHIRSIFNALKTTESMGVRLRAVTEKPKNLNRAKCPWFYPMRLCIKELVAILAWPLGEERLAGVSGVHPKLLLPPTWYKGESRQFGYATGFHESEMPLGISARDSLEHTILLAPTGGGKSTVMLNLTLADIRAGRSVLVIDPKADLVNDVLARMPVSRINDVVVLDPTDAHPVGFNPLIDKTRNASLVADSVLATFRDMFADSWGIRTQDVLSAALLTLINYGKANGNKVSLVWLSTLLTDVNFRRKVVNKVVANDPLGLGTFWKNFEAMSAAERNQVIAPVLNKLRQFLLRPQLRHVLGQTDPKFTLSNLFHSRKIVLVPLNKGIIGSGSARLLGSLIVGQLWTLAPGRASIPPEKRHIINVFIDEVQDYLSLPTDLADALSQARGLGVAITMAHQYRAQLPPSLRAGIDANARNKIVFGLNATDARDMAAMATETGLVAQDFTLLPRYGVYANLQAGGRSTGWMSGFTLPAPEPTMSAVNIRARSMSRYGQDAEAVERELLKVLSISQNTVNKADTVPIGRKKKGGNDAEQ